MIFTFHAISSSPVRFDRVFRVTAENAAASEAHLARMMEARDSMLTVLDTPGVPGPDRVAAIVRYLPYARSLVVMFESNPGMRMNEVLHYEWSSILHRKANKKIEISQKYYDMAQLLTSLASSKCQEASELMHAATGEESFKEHAKLACKLLREAAGLFDYNAEHVLSRWATFPAKRPPEVMITVARALALICVAQANALAVKKASLDGSPPSMLTKLLFGIMHTFEQAEVLLSESNSLDDMVKHFPLFVTANAAFHRAVAYKLTAEAAAAEKIDGVPNYACAIPLIDEAKRCMDKAVKIKLPDELSELRGEIEAEKAHLEAIHCKFHGENDTVYFVGTKDLALVELPAPRDLFKPLDWTPPEPLFTSL